MHAKGIIGKYAVGGASAVTFYAEPIATKDLDIFFLFQPPQEGLILSLEPIYDYCRANGYSYDHEFVSIGGWDVQFVESGHDLLWIDALANARTFNFDGSSIDVLPPELDGATWIAEINIEIVTTDVAVTGGTSSDHAPNSWVLSGSAPKEYETALDPQLARSGQASRFLRSSTSEPHEFGTWMTGADAEPYRGKRVRLSAWVRADTIDGWAGLWMRVDPKTALAFDNMAVFGLVEMILFILTVFVAYAYVWRRGGLEWD